MSISSERESIPIEAKLQLMDPANHLNCRKHQLLAVLSAIGFPIELVMFNALFPLHEIYENIFRKKLNRWVYPSEFLIDTTLRRAGVDLQYRVLPNCQDIARVFKNEIYQNKVCAFFGAKGHFDHWGKFLKNESLMAQYNSAHSFLVGDVRAEEILILDEFNAFEKAWYPQNVVAKSIDMLQKSIPSPRYQVYLVLDTKTTFATITNDEAISKFKGMKSNQNKTQNVYLKIYEEIRKNQGNSVEVFDFLALAAGSRYYAGIFDNKILNGYGGIIGSESKKLRNLIFKLMRVEKNGFFQDTNFATEFDELTESENEIAFKTNRICKEEK